jgi:hypothetical protein
MTFNKFFSLSSKVGRASSKQKCQFSTFSKQFNNSYQYSNPSKSQLKVIYVLLIIILFTNLLFLVGLRSRFSTSRKLMLFHTMYAFFNINKLGCLWIL